MSRRMHVVRVERTERVEQPRRDKFNENVWAIIFMVILLFALDGYWKLMAVGVLVNRDWVIVPRFTKGEPRKEQRADDTATGTGMELVRVRQALNTYTRAVESGQLRTHASEDCVQEILAMLDMASPEPVPDDPVPFERPNRTGDHE